MLIYHIFILLSLNFILNCDYYLIWIVILIIEVLMRTLSRLVANNVSMMILSASKDKIFNMFINYRGEQRGRGLGFM